MHIFQLILIICQFSSSIGAMHKIIILKLVAKNKKLEIREWIYVHKQPPESFHKNVLFKTPITESGANRSSVGSEEYCTTPATEILNFEAFAISWVSTIDGFTGSNEIYLFWLKVVVITVKGVSEFGMVIDSLFCIRECNRWCLYCYSSTYLIQEIHGQLKKKKEKWM